MGSHSQFGFSGYIRTNHTFKLLGCKQHHVSMALWALWSSRQNTLDLLLMNLWKIKDLATVMYKLGCASTGLLVDVRDVFLRR